MMKWILKDYFAAFSWNRVVEMNKKNYLLKNIALYVILVCFIEWLNPVDVLPCLVAMYVPTLFMMISQQLHPIVATKLFYLCPMERNERKDLMFKMYFVAIAIPVAFSAVINGIFVVSGICEWTFGVGAVFYMYVFAHPFCAQMINNKVKFLETLKLTDVLSLVFTTRAHYVLYFSIDVSLPWKMVILSGLELIGLIIWYWGWKKARKQMLDYESLTLLKADSKI